MTTPSIDLQRLGAGGGDERGSRLGEGEHWPAAPAAT